MLKNKYLEQIYNSSFKDELEKISEENKLYNVISMINEPIKNISSQEEEFKENRKNAIKSVYPIKITAGLTSLPATLFGIKAFFDSRKNNNNETSSYEDELKLKKSMNVSDDVKIFRNSEESLRGGGGSFNPANRTINYVASPKTTEFQRAVLSHELGHSKNYTPKTTNIILGFRRYGKIGSGIGLAGAALSKDSENSKRFAIAGSVMATPTFIEETLATARGIRGLQQYHGGGISGLKNALLKGKAGGSRMALGNLLSYGLLAAAPTIAYNLKEYHKSKPTELNNV